MLFWHLELLESQGQGAASVFVTGEAVLLVWDWTMYLLQDESKSNFQTKQILVNLHLRQF